MSTPIVPSVLELLKYINENENTSTLTFSKNYNIDHQVVVGILKNLESTEKVVSEMKSYNKLELTEEGEQVKNLGSYEFQIFSSIPINGINRDDLVKTANDKIGFAKAMSNKWIGFSEKDGVKLIVKKSDNVVDKVKLDLEQLENFQTGDQLLNDYKKRKLIKDVTVKYFIMRKGPKFSTTDDQDAIAVITEENIKCLDFNSCKFKPYNLHGGIVNRDANLHPLLKMRKEYKRILIELGFMEMPTNNYVESSFWNFDALFQPQDHSARDAHDTFYLSEPQKSDQFPQEYLERVSDVHSKGGYGSQGYRNPWKLEEARKNLLRTHTTAVSARMLYRLSQEKKFTPVKYFSINRVFRNESLDATHLAEFHQVEGLIADRGLSLANLQSTIAEFFKKLGMDRIRFKPAYNPYTEPSMEIFAFHNGLGKWIEVGNSGMFRPEMLLPMGLPSDVNVIAWGLSLERPTMIKYRINDIRELMGQKMDLNRVFANPICRLD